MTDVVSFTPIVRVLRDTTTGPDGKRHLVVTATILELGRKMPRLQEGDDVWISYKKYDRLASVVRTPRCLSIFEIHPSVVRAAGFERYYEITTRLNMLNHSTPATKKSSLDLHSQVLVIQFALIEPPIYRNLLSRF